MNASRDSAIVYIGLISVLIGCARPAKVAIYERGEVEVAPSVFAPVGLRSAGSTNNAAPTLYDHAFPKKENLTDFTELEVDWNGRQVHWQGNAHPVNLRVLEGKLYLIAFDRTSKGHNHAIFRYYAQDGTNFIEISPTAFPKAVAGQNMGFFYREFMCGNDRRDLVQLARDMDPSDPCFARRLTAYIWAHLATGQQYFESESQGAISEALLREFARTNHPIRLTAIIRDKRKYPAALTNVPPRTP